MAEEPQPDPTPPSAPPSVPAADTEDAQPPKPTSGEDRKTQAALSSLQTDDAAPSSQKSLADQKALGEAMSRLEIVAGTSKAGNGGKEGAAEADGAALKKQKEDEEERRRKIKVDAGDVALLASGFPSYNILASPPPF